MRAIRHFKHLFDMQFYDDNECDYYSDIKNYFNINSNNYSNDDLLLDLD